ncbi:MULTISPECIES: hypothetical protein [unclassified Streptomyces]|uniref:hypothetical protein n=1 Tax=unclassified Streptomyces TaxID=2593676 RepID=UPI0036662D3A
MPGQRKRKRQQRREADRRAADFAPEAGHWEVLFSTQDESEWRAELRRLHALPRNEQIDWSMARIDVMCGRLIHPTTYRLSLFTQRAP